MAEHFESLVDLWEKSCAKFAGRQLFGTKGKDGWSWITYGQFKKTVDDFRAGLGSLGIGPGDRVGIIADNRPEWAVACYAAYGRSAAFVPMYESQLAKDWEYVVRDSELKVLFAATPEIYEKTKGFPAKVPTLKHVALVVGDGPEPTYRGLLKKGSESPVPAIAERR